MALDHEDDSDWRRLDEWLVLFSDAPTRGWYRLLKPGFRHVRAIAYDPLFDIWIMFDANADQIVIRPISRETVNCLLAYTRRYNGRVVKAATHKRRLGWRPPSCAAAIGELFGVSALTPFALHRRLLAQGATEI